MKANGFDEPLKQNKNEIQNWQTSTAKNWGINNFSFISQLIF